ncbi:hypothetical protein GCM10022200_08920 [Microbacterium awajiense]|uniref:Uncharacterized protein n=1 Tax=Microbacterium awajiense TaxID=415214 RepID=A0ABP7AB82_9MICO
MSDPERARPQYGEYATPEEQRARIQEPESWMTAPEQPAPPTTAPAPVSVAAPALRADGTAATLSRGRLVDRVATMVLLAYGLLNIILTAPAMIDYRAYAEQVIAGMGVEATLSDPTTGQPWGVAAVAVLSLGWIATAGLCWLRARRGRLTWWVALVGGVLFTFLSGTLMVVPIMNDPAVWNALVDQVAG